MGLTFIELAISLIERAIERLVPYKHGAHRPAV